MTTAVEEDAADGEARKRVQGKERRKDRERIQKLGKAVKLEQKGDRRGDKRTWRRKKGRKKRREYSTEERSEREI